MLSNFLQSFGGFVLGLIVVFVIYAIVIVYKLLSGFRGGN